MKKFIDEEIKVVYEKEFFLSKKPSCPDFILWRETRFYIDELISSWFDFSRKGNKSRNMREEHLQQAKEKGSWGVGRYYFKFREKSGQIFTIYYDRSPKNVDDKKGKWILFTIE